MKYGVVLLFFFLANSCQRAKTLTYEEGLENCNRMQEGSVDCIIGAQIPEFEATTLEGKKINRASLKGKPTIINFWFTTCAPCVAEIPGLNAIANKFGTNINCLAIGREDSQDIKEFLVENPWEFEQIPDGNEITRNVFNMKWGFPTTFLLNKNAEIILAFSGGKADSTAVTEIQKKLVPLIERALK